ncbi:MAG: hypothetical protein ACLT0W_05550 [Clostridium sp.]
MEVDETTVGSDEDFEKRYWLMIIPHVPKAVIWQWKKRKIL